MNSVFWPPERLPTTVIAAPEKPFVNTAFIRMLSSGPINFLSNVTLVQVQEGTTVATCKGMLLLLKPVRIAQVPLTVIVSAPKSSKETWSAGSDL